MNDAAASHPVQATVVDFINATNAFDIERALALFSTTAVIDDPSTGCTFNEHAGVRDYLEKYFLGYHTVTRCCRWKVLAMYVQEPGSISLAISVTRSDCF